MRNVDHGVYYEKMLAGYLAEPIRILELGSGTGFLSPIRAGRLAKIWGIDPDKRILDNQEIDVAIVKTIEQADFEENYFDLVCSRFVFEHLSDPVDVLNRVYTWLKPGGKVLILTVNSLHYFSWMNRLVPRRWRGRLSGRLEHDIFPTLYRFNNPFRISLNVAQSRFGRRAEVRIFLCEKYLYCEPVPLRLVSRLYSLLVNCFDFLRWLRVGLIIEITRPE